MSQKWFKEEGMDLYKGKVWIKVTTMDEPTKPFPLGWTKLYIEVHWQVDDLPHKNKKERKGERERAISSIPKTNLLSPSSHLAMYLFPSIPVPSYPFVHLGHHVSD